MAVKFGAGCGVVSIAEKTPSSEPGLSAAPPAGKFDFLMDAELDVTVRFGKKSMLLREIMELDAGAVVELDRQAWMETTACGFSKLFPRRRADKQPERQRLSSLRLHSRALSSGPL